MPSVGKRIIKIAEMTGKNRIVADIGADHGYLTILLLQTNRAEKVIAGELNSLPAQRAKDNIKEAGLQDRAEVRIGDGLSVLGNDIPDCVVIAGIGGIATAAILEKGSRMAGQISNFILQPANREEILREYLYANGYGIVKEELVKENRRLFVVMHAMHQSEAQTYTIEDVVLGKYIPYRETAHREEYLNKKLRYIRNAIAEMQNSNRDLNDKKQQYEELYKKLLRVAKNMKSESVSE